MTERESFFKYCVDIAICVLLIAVLIAVILVASRDGDAYGAAQIIKEKRLNDAPHPRAVFIGGSGLAFGLDSQLIDEETDLHPVNLGLYAGYRIDYLLSQAHGGLNSGDTTVIIPEYDILTASPSASGFLVLEAAQANPAGLRYAFSNTHSLVAVVREFPTWLSTRVVSMVGRYIVRPFTGRSDTLYHRVYRKSGFNTFGDDRASDNETYRLPRSELSTSSAQTLLLPLNETTLARIDEFIQTEEQRGVHVYISWPALPETLTRLAAHDLVRSEARMRDLFGTHILGSQSDFVYSDDSFFDTVNHLAPAAREDRTRTIIRLLAERN